MTFSHECCGNTSVFLWMLSLLAFFLYTAGFASPAWMVKKYEIRSPVNPALVVSVVDSDIGLVYACNDIITISGNNTDKCESILDIDSNLVEDWRWIVGGLGTGALVTSFLALLTISYVACKKTTGHVCLRALIALLYLITGGLLVAVLIMFNHHKVVEVIKTPFSFKTEYGFGWSYAVVVTSSAVFFFLALVHALIAFLVPS